MQNTDTTPTNTEAKKIVIYFGSWSGQTRPYVAEVYVDGKYKGRTGFCKGPSASIAAGRKIAMKHAGKNTTVSSIGPICAVTTEQLEKDFPVQK